MGVAAGGASAIVAPLPAECRRVSVLAVLQPEQDDLQKSQWKMQQESGMLGAVEDAAGVRYGFPLEGKMLVVVAR